MTGIVGAGRRGNLLGQTHDLVTRRLAPARRGLAVAGRDRRNITIW
ncbi:MAG: hypothetical protein KJ069_00665 [Anaerolineae bacterium]|nr:hypothetical protein [Anaerolineae bacterium]